VVEKKMVSRLGQLRERFGGLDTGVARSAAAARSFAEAGLKVVLIGSAEAPDKSAARFASWADLAERGL
jgi:hypothetical protein